MSGNTKDKIAVRNNAGKTCSPKNHRNTLGKSRKKEAQQIDYTARSLRSDRALAKLGRYVATEHAHSSVAT
ncbi:hypothetical protein F2Q68_00011133 [Brassica cretica]|uniref:Uncharacterized protein n=1 Tax=Brassica cretica TaxID=69181 RepID=A0A8S9L2S6_BRACR|nr:hypothetical protein F2Q68_00011133 [Brassica cretica]